MGHHFPYNDQMYFPAPVGLSDPKSQETFEYDEQPYKCHLSSSRHYQSKLLDQSPFLWSRWQFHP